MTKHTPPQAIKKAHKTVRHGHTYIDDYAWLKDKSWQEVLKEPKKLHADIRAYLDAENAYTKALTERLAPLQETLFTEVKGRIEEEVRATPMQQGPYWYSYYIGKGQEYKTYCRTLGEDGAQETFFDENKAAQNYDFYKLATLRVSPDHKKVALMEDTNGSESFTLRILDIATQEELITPIPGLDGDVVWANDNKTLFYVTVDENHNPNGVKKHVIGAKEADAYVYQEEDKGFFIGLSRTLDGAYIKIDAGDHHTNEIHILDANTPEGAFKCFSPRLKGVRYGVKHSEGTFYIRTNKDAQNFKICTCTAAHTHIDGWQDFIPHRDAYLLKSIFLIKGKLLRKEIYQALPRLIIYDLKTNKEEVISFPDAAYDLRLLGSMMFETDHVYFMYTSPKTPAQTFCYNVRTNTRTLVDEQKVPSGHKPEDYIVEALKAPSHDGVEVPITVLRHKNTPIDGSAPLWLYGYGSYGHRIEASFNHHILTLVDRGFVFAIAHIRGGTECGYHWYLDAIKEKKENTFHDFIAVAEHLIEHNYTAAGNIFAEGRSAGGLLMGAVTNMRPDLWKLVHLGVPFVDVLNTMCDKSLPLTPGEWPEWGNPIEDAAACKTIAGYCPYTNLVEKEYPHTLLTSSLTDYRVTYWEPAKYTAKMRAVNKADTYTFLKMDMETGHGGASGRFEYFKEKVFVFAVVLWLFNMENS